MNKAADKSSIIAFLWPIIKPFKIYFFFLLIVPIYTGLADLIYFYCVKLFIDVITGPFTYNDLIYPLTIFFISPIILTILWRILDVLEWRVNPIIRKKILLNSYDYVQHNSYYFFQNNLAGSITSKLKGILDSYDKLFSRSLIKDFCIFSVMIFSGLITIFYIDVSLGFFVLGWLLVVFFIMYKMTKKLDKLVYLETESRHNIIGSIADKITNILSIFYFSARKRELADLEQQITNDFIPKQIRVYKYDFFMNTISWSLYFIMWLFFVFALIHARHKEFISAGTIAFAFGMVSKISDATWILSMKLQELVKLIGDFKASFEVLKMPNTKQDKNGVKELIIQKPSIEFRNIYFNYANTQVFTGLNLTIKPGENVGIVGHSGEGKTSLVNILLRFFEIQKGNIFIDGQDISEVTVDSLRTNISVIPQDVMLFHRSLLENISYGNPKATYDEIINAAKLARIHNFIETLPGKYNTSVGERGTKLSGGQRQRIAIARAILKNAPILILDEATSALDSRTEKDIQDSINYFLEEKGQTVLAIAHRLSTLRHMDRIVVIDKGTIVEEGQHNTLMKKKASIYRKLWQEQMPGYSAKHDCYNEII